MCFPVVFFFELILQRLLERCAQRQHSTGSSEQLEIPWYLYLNIGMKFSVAKLKIHINGILYTSFIHKYDTTTGPRGRSAL